MNIVSAIYTASLAVAFATLFVVTLLSLLAVRRRLFEQSGELASLAESLQQLREQRDTGTAAAARQLGQQLARLDGRIAALAEAQSDLRRLPGGSAYDDATELARRGLDAGELIARCGIPAGEAELLVRLQRATPDTYTN
jgi:C4-dicarboxylate-specific signal transduction histidine kinase